MSDETAGETSPNPYDLKQAIGGVRGFIDSSIAPAVFVIVRITTHELNKAIWASVAVGAAIMALRISRKESVQQAVSGFIGIAIAAAVSGATGTGKGFFLPGIIMVAAMGVVGLISVLARRPFVGFGLMAFDPERFAGWRQNPALLRACMISSSVWTFTFFLRAIVATSVYTMKGDRDGLLLVVINLVKIPSMIVAGCVTYFLVKAVMPPPVDRTPEP